MTRLEFATLYLALGIVAGAGLLAALWDDEERPGVWRVLDWLFVTAGVVGAVLAWPVTVAVVAGCRTWEGVKARREERRRQADYRAARAAEELRERRPELDDHETHLKLAARPSVGCCPRCGAGLEPQGADSDGLVRRFLCHGCETWYTRAQLEGRSPYFFRQGGEAP